MTDPLVLRRLALALAAGDGLGSTVEFMPAAEVPRALAALAGSGWPFRQVGGGPFGWPAGAATDDTEMALCLLRSHAAHDDLPPDDVVARFRAWLDGGPIDVGVTTRATLAAARPDAPHDGGRDHFRRSPHSAANGSLMRNGVTAAMADSLEEAWRLGLVHGAITHYAPLPVLCCAVQTFLIRGWLEGGDPLADAGWLDAMLDRWRTWLAAEAAAAAGADPLVAAWAEETRDHLEPACARLRSAELDPDRFDPFSTPMAGIEGWCLLTLQVGVWAAAWAARGEPVPAPERLPRAVIERATGPSVLAAVALIGHDADTYGATAGPMVAAAAGDVPEELLAGLAARDEIDRLTTTASPPA